MKTTLELPEEIFRQVKAHASAEGMSLKSFVTEALEMKLRSLSSAGKKPWMNHFGALRHLGAERKGIEERISGEFGQVDPKEWS